MFVAGLVGTVAAVAVPSMRSALDDLRIARAIRYFVSRLQEARADSIKRSANTAFRFALEAGDYVHRVYVDGSGDGVHT
jgi:Tfp pilus assembly protein FimT